jgi:hypothetical protein
MPINVLFAAHPAPPVQPAVGNAPIGFLNALPAGHFVPAQFNGYNVNAPLTRTEVREICRNESINPLAAYAVAMAWGFQKRGHFRTSIAAPTLIPLLNKLRSSENTRSRDFAIATDTAATIPGLKIAFFTKLLYFFRPKLDAFILDQWTAKSACLLFNPCHVRLGERGNGFPPHKHTTPAEYEAFCLAVDGIANVLWPGVVATGAQAEAAMFDTGHGRGYWRNFVDGHFSHSEVGSQLSERWICCTTAQDFDDGWLLLQRDQKVQVFFTIPLRGSLHLRVLLARLRELGATDVFFNPDGAIPLPDWFCDGCHSLNVEIHGGNQNGGHGGGGGAPMAPQPNDSPEGGKNTGGNQNSDGDQKPLQSGKPTGSLAVEVTPQARNDQAGKPIENDRHGGGVGGKITEVIEGRKRDKIVVYRANGSYLPITQEGGNNIGYICHKSPNGGHYGKIAIYPDFWEILPAAGFLEELPTISRAPFGNPDSMDGEIRVFRPAGNSPRHAIQWLERFFIVENKSGY